MDTNDIQIDDAIYVLVRADDSFCIHGFNVFSHDLDEAPTYTLGETQKIILEPGERWEMIVPASYS